MIRTTAVLAVVGLSFVAACRKRKLDAIDRVEVQPPGYRAPLPDPRPVGALLLEAQRRGGGRAFSRVVIEFVGPDGIMDPAFATLEVWLGADRAPVDDPNRKTGAPVTEPPVTKAAQCPRLTWKLGRWDMRNAACPSTTGPVHCTVAVIWERAIAQGAPRDAVAKLTLAAVPTGNAIPASWKFEIDDAVREVHFRKSFPDDCGEIAEAPDPSVVQDLPVPDGLDRQMISNAIGVVRPKVAACGTGTSARGTVKVAVKVAPEGKVTSVTLSATPERALGECVRNALLSAEFTKTAKGGSFSYPFVF